MSGSPEINVMEAFFNNLPHDNKKEGVSCYIDTPSL